MASYSIEVAKSAEKVLLKLPKKVVPGIIDAIQSLADTPCPAGCRKLRGEEDAFRIRVGVYRIIYEVHAQQILIKVLKIGHRKDIYR